MPYFREVSFLGARIKNPKTCQVIASEDWNGMREDFKMASDVITFRVDYAPRVNTL